MRILLSSHHLFSKEQTVQVYNLYKLVVDDELSNNEEVVSALEFSVAQYEKVGTLPARARLETELQFPLKDIIDEAKVKHHFEDIVSKVRHRKLKKDILCLSAMNNKDEVFNHMEKIKRDYCDLAEEKKKLSNTKDMTIDGIVNAPNYGTEGALTNIRELDAHLNSIGPGNTVILCAGRSMCKSTFIDNFIYTNSTQRGFNVLHFSLEIPKDYQYLKMISRHSYQLNPSTAIEYKRIKDKGTTEEEMERLIEIEKDWKENMKGSVRFIDMSDGVRFNPESLESLLEDIYREEPFDLLTFDYIQLTKYSAGGGKDVKEFMNSLVSVIRRKTVSIGANKDKIASVILSQANRDGIRRADRSQGSYDLNALAEVNELERAGTIIIFLYMNDVLRSSGEVKWQLLKYRDGSLLTDPHVTFVDPSFAMLGENQAYDEVFDEESISILQETEGIGEDIFGGEDHVF